MATQDYSPEERNTTNDVINLYANTGVFLIDPNNALLKDFYDIQLKLAGIGSVTYPAFVQQWNNAKQLKSMTGSLDQAMNGLIQPVHSIVGLDSTDGLFYTANALGSLPVSASNVTQTLGLFDGQANNVGTVNFSKNYGQAANCAIQANGNFPSSIINNNYPVTIIYTFAQTINQQTVYGAEIVTTQSYPKNIQNDSPTDLNQNDEIKICLTRDAADCDYRHNYDGTVSVPIKGSIIYYGNIDLVNGQPVKTDSSIYLIRVSAGGDPIIPAGNFDFFKDPNTHINGDTLSWDLNWLNFSQVDFSSGDMVYYVFKVSLNVGGKSVVSFITNAPNTIVPGQRFLNTVTIKPMQILYGCLGKDTRILMRDNSEKIISTIKTGEWVHSQDGRMLRVEDVIAGKEKSYLEIKVKDIKRKEKTIITSLGHPFCTPEGVVLARELTTSSKLITLNGECSIDTIVQKTGEIKVYNLHLSTDDLTSEQLKGKSTMYANGVLVGDSVMQRTYEDAYNQRPVNILKTLPKEWHVDYKNHIKLMGK